MSAAAGSADSAGARIGSRWSARIGSVPHRGVPVGRQGGLPSRASSPANLRREGRGPQTVAMNEKGSEGRYALLWHPAGELLSHAHGGGSAAASRASCDALRRLLLCALTILN